MSSYQDFTFTAISGHDILAASDSNLNCGDSFTMGFSANVHMTVSDNDSRLSGDARRNEQGDDRRGQTAEIEVDGAVLHSGAKIYAEQVYVLTDANGGWHFLVEIEVAGAAGSDLDDFYAFLGDAPPAGAVLTVAGQFNVRGNWLKYRDLTGGLNWDLDGNGAVTVEAEDLALTNYRIDDVDAASNGEVIKLKRGEGEAGVTFGAESGVYDLAVAYIDENDGQGMIEVLLNGALIQTITLDQDDNGNGDDASTISTIVIESLNLNQGDAIVLRGARDGGEFARIDALTFTSAGTKTAPEANAEAGSIAQGATLSLDLLSNDSDAEGDTLFITEAGGAPVGIEGCPVADGTTEGGAMLDSGRVTASAPSGASLAAGTSAAPSAWLPPFATASSVCCPCCRCARSIASFASTEERESSGAAFMSPDCSLNSQIARRYSGRIRRPRHCCAPPLASCPKRQPHRIPPEMASAPRSGRYARPVNALGSSSKCTTPGAIRLSTSTPLPRAGDSANMSSPGAWCSTTFALSGS